MKSTYGTACELMATKRIDSAIISDSKGRFGGRFRIDSICNLWWEWRKLSHYLAHNNQSIGSSYSSTISKATVPPILNLQSMQDNYAVRNYTLETIKTLSDPTYLPDSALFNGTTYKVFDVLLKCVTSCNHIGVYYEDFDVIHLVRENEAVATNSTLWGKFVA